MREGIVKGPAVGATAEGYIDYLQHDVHMRGTSGLEVATRLKRSSPGTAVVFYSGSSDAATRPGKACRRTERSADCFL